MVTNKEELYNTYVSILKEELVPAMGCTEPIAIAYCSSKARDVLAEEVTSVKVEVSGNILKNVKSVVVPNSDGKKGIKAACLLGIVAGNTDLGLEVISQVSSQQKQELNQAIESLPFDLSSIDGSEPLCIRVSLQGKNHSSMVEIARSHTNIVRIEKDDKCLFKKELSTIKQRIDSRSLLSVEGIIDFADNCNLALVKETLDRQISYNYRIAQEGLKNDYGANIGKVLLNRYGNDIFTRVKAVACCGSDARMSGCELPVIINSGSGNQGMTCSLPVIEYAKLKNMKMEQLYRALLVSNLLTIHQKTGIGKLSAYCGVICAGSASGCGIAYLEGGKSEAISHTLVNALAIVSGIICDGASASCAAKIASAVDAGIMGYNMYLENQQFYGGDGIVSQGVENTIKNISRLGCEGMKETDKEIIKIMLDC